MKQESSLQRTKIIQDCVLFIVWPFFSLLYSLINSKREGTKNVLWFFCAFFGYTFVISSPGIDGAYYAAALSYYNDLDIDTYDFLSMLYQGAIGRGDYYQPILTFIVSRVTDDYRVLFALFGFVFGFFYSRNIWFLIEKMGSKAQKYALPFLVLFIFLVPFWHINGVRFYTALHVLTFGVLYFFQTRKKRYLLHIGASILIHFSFIIPVLIFLLLLAGGSRSWIYFFVLVLALFYSSVDLSTTMRLVPVGIDIYEDRIAGYTNQEFIEGYRKGLEESKWFIRFRYDILTYFIAVSSGIAIAFKGRSLRAFKYSYLLFYGILIFSLSYVFRFFPSMSRFLTLSAIFTSAFYFLYFQSIQGRFWIRAISYLTWVPALLFLIIEIRIGMDFIGIGSFIGNPLIAPLFEYRISIAELVGR